MTKVIKNNVKKPIFTVPHVISLLTIFSIILRHFVSKKILSVALAL